MRRWVLGLCLVVLVACGSDDSGYDDEVREGFLDSCIRTGGEQQRDLCECRLDRLIQEVPYERFEEVDEAMREPGATVPDDIAEAVEPCSN